MLKVINSQINAFEGWSRYEGEVIWKGRFSCRRYRGTTRRYVRDSQSVINGKGKLRKRYMKMVRVGAQFEQRRGGDWKQSCTDRDQEKTDSPQSQLARRGSTRR
jgi:hypothetical protein